MSTTRAGVVIDALVSVLTNAGLTAVDGMPVRSGETAHDVVYVGWDGSDTVAVDAAQAHQEWASLGNRARNEELTVICYAEATRGTDVMKTTRDGALALTAAVETTVRSDPTLGGALNPPGQAEYGETRSLAQARTAKGTRVGVVFTISVFARL